MSGLESFGAASFAVAPVDEISRPDLVNRVLGYFPDPPPSGLRRSSPVRCPCLVGIPWLARLKERKKDEVSVA